MKKFLLLFALSLSLAVSAQTITLAKGKLLDSLVINDSIPEKPELYRSDNPETFALYLPKSFDTSKIWPIVFVFDMKGRAKQALAMMRAAAEAEGYILAGSNNINDSLSIANNVLVTSRMMNQVAAMFPIHKDRIYAAGFAGGGRLASVLPTFVKRVSGVISCGAAITNLEVLNARNPFHFIGIVGNEDYNYPEMLANEKQLKRIKFPNQLYVFEGGAKWPTTDYLVTALQTFTLAAIAKGRISKDQGYVQQAYRAHLVQANQFIAEQKAFLGQNRLWEIMEVFQPHIELDSLKESSKLLRKTKLYRSQKRSQSAILFKESLSKDDYVYYLEDDVLTYNYNNLGWWKYQMEELQKNVSSGNIFEQQMGKRLQGYLNALIEDYLDVLVQEKTVDTEAVNFLWMLKTITQPKNAENYLKVIGNSALLDDYGTALFYLEELLKNGYTDKAKIYDIQHTALLRITPEFNEIVEKYLKDARYEPIEE